MTSPVLPPAQGAGLIDPVAVAHEGGKDSGGFWHDVLRRLRRNPTAWIGAAIVAIFLLIALLAPLIAPYPETALPGAKFITPTHIPGPGELPTRMPGVAQPVRSVERSTATVASIASGSSRNVIVR